MNKFNNTLWLKLLIKTKIKLLFFCCAATLLATPSQSQSFIEQGQYQLHYQAFHSVDVDPKALRLHQLKRAPNVGMLNISLIKVLADGTRESQTATIEVISNNLVGQNKSLVVKPIVESNAVYYISQFRFANEETFRFHIKATPENDPNETLSVSFNQRFFVNK